MNPTHEQMKNFWQNLASGRILVKSDQQVDYNIKRGFVADWGDNQAELPIKPAKPVSKPYVAPRQYKPPPNPIVKPADNKGIAFKGGI